MAGWASQQQSAPPAAPSNRPLGQSITGVGTLLLWFTSARTMAAALSFLRDRSRAYLVDGSSVSLRLLDGEAPEIVLELCGHFSRKEAEHTRALFVGGSAQPRASDCGGLVSLAVLAAIARSGNLIDQLAQGRFTSHFHAIVEARAPYRVFAHEALLRGLDHQGCLQAPEPLFALARASGLLPELDAAACRTAIRSAVRHGLGHGVFINFAPAAVEDPERHLAALEAVFGEAGLSKQSVVFEVVEADRLDNSEQLEQILRAYRNAGFRFALDDLGAGWSSLGLVHRIQPDFIKLDRALIRGVHQDGVKAKIVGKLLELCRELGIASIVEGVEEMAELRWVCDHGADFVQGFLYGRPTEIPVLHLAIA